MVFALVHFTVGFVAVLVVLCVVPITRYRLTGAYAGGVWALGPDVHHVLDGSLSAGVFALHSSPAADLFFLHHTLDSAAFRAHTIELTFVATATLALTMLAFDRRFGRIHPAPRRVTSAGVDDGQPSD